MRQRYQPALFSLAAAAPVLFVLVPTLTFVANSFYGMADGQIVRTLSLANYIEFATNPTYAGF